MGPGLRGRREILSGNQPTNNPESRPSTPTLPLDIPQSATSFRSWAAEFTNLYGSAPPAPPSFIERWRMDDYLPSTSSTRSTSVPAADTDTKYPTDSIGLLLSDFRTISHIRQLEKHFLTHIFVRSAEREQVYFEDSKWSDFDLKVVLQYAVQIVDLALEHYRDTLIETNRPMVAALLELDPSPFIAREDLAVFGIIELAKLRRATVEELEVGDETFAVLAVLGKLKTKLFNSCTAEHKHRQPLSDDLRRSALKAWLECPERMDYTLPRIPMKLLQPHFTREDVNWAAWYVKRLRRNALNHYRERWDSIVHHGYHNRVESRGCVSYQRLEKDLVRKHMDLFDFDELSDSDIKGFRWDIEDQTFDVGNGSRMSISDPHIDETELSSESQHDLRRIQVNWRWSIAEFARHAGVIDLELFKLERTVTALREVEAEISPISPTENFFQGLGLEDEVSEHESEALLDRLERSRRF